MRAETRYKWVVESLCPRCGHTPVEWPTPQTLPALPFYSVPFYHKNPLAPQQLMAARSKKIVQHNQRSVRPAQELQSQLPESFPTDEAAQPASEQVAEVEDDFKAPEPEDPTVFGLRPQLQVRKASMQERMRK